MQIYKTRGNLIIYQGADVARGLFIAENKKTGKLSDWNNTPDFKITDCKY
jgi:hypothetical protein